MFFKIKAYLIFLLKSTNQHGVHSPFVFDLTTKCLYQKQLQEKFSVFVEYKKSLKRNKSIINVTDFGAGSKVFTSSARPISLIAKYAGVSNKRAALLMQLTNYLKPTKILEIGTSLGLSTAAMKLGAPKAIITSLEGCPETARIAEQQLTDFEFKDINIVIGDFKETLNAVLLNNTFDFIYFDGNHQEKPTIDYFEQCLQAAHNDSVFIFDDIHWSPEMEKAWRYIKEHPKVKVTIDTFQWGLVFFRKEQEKEHFTIRV